MDTMPYSPYSPYDRQQRENRTGLKLLLVAAVLATVGALIGILVLPAGGPHEEEAGVLPVGGVSPLVYPASLLREMTQPTNEQWLSPAAVVNTAGATFVLDTGNDRILKLDQSGLVLATFDSSSDGRLILRQPMAMTSDGQRLFVANSLAGEVIVVDLSGRVEKVFPLPPTPAGNKPPRPIGIALTREGNIVVSDAESHRILLLDSEGRTLKTMGTGTRAGGADGFNVPGAVTVDSANNIYVVDVLNGRVVEISANGAFRRQFGQLGETAGTLSRPKGVAVDATGRVFVSDGLLAAVEVFAPDGTYLGLIGRRDPVDLTSGSLFQAPAGLWLADNTLYVIDRFVGLITFQLP